MYEKSLDQVKYVYERSHNQINEDIMRMESEAVKRRASIRDKPESMKRFKQIEREMVE